MARDLGMHIYYECEITDWPIPMADFMRWCEQHVQGNWNVVADSGSQATRGDGGHCVIFLCDSLSDLTAVKLHWQ